MNNQLIKVVEAPFLKKSRPHFAIGDTVTVSVRIVEGNKERVQPFTGVVIARRGSGLTETVTVRRIVNNEGVERVFPLHSPHVTNVEILRSGKVRRAKLYFLRGRVGKARKLRERRTKDTGRSKGANGSPGPAGNRSERRPVTVEEPEPQPV